MGKILRLPEVADLFGVSADAVRNWCKSGRIQCLMTPGGQYRIPEEAFDSFNYSSEDYRITLNREMGVLDKLKHEAEQASIEHIKSQQARLRARISKLKANTPDKDDQIRKMLEAGAPYSQIELDLQTSPTRISRISKAMKGVRA